MGNDSSHIGGNFYTRAPLYLRIIIGLLLGVVVGVVIRQVSGEEGGPPWTQHLLAALDNIARLLLRLLNAIAPPLILFAIVRSLITADIKGRQAGRLIYLLVLNTCVAIAIGLLVANVIQPGRHAHLSQGTIPQSSANPFDQLLDAVPRSFLGPFGDEANTIGVIIIAVSVGLAVRRLSQPAIDSVLHGCNVAFDILVILLHWVIQLVPLAVLAKVAAIIAKEGFDSFKAVAWFILAVLVALALQATYYLVRVRLGSWVKPFDLIRGTRDALLLAFSTSSSTATMPVTYQNLKDRVGLRPQSASMGALVGTNFNNDGTALYEAMSALFISQMLGQHLSIVQQLLVAITSVAASVGAAGIPEAGLVTMTLVFNAVHLPVGYIALLLPVDWFLDRSRTMVNVMGDMNVSCLLDGKERAREKSLVRE